MNKTDTRPVVTIVSFLYDDGISYDMLNEQLEAWDDVEVPKEDQLTYFHKSAKEFLEYFSDNKEKFKEAYERVGKANERT